MSRVVQLKGKKGSLKWIQSAINQPAPRSIDNAILPFLKNASEISWSSPLIADDFAEYRDESFLEKIGATDLARDLSRFGPNRGPQWDALAVSGGDILLVEAKAHIQEMLSSPTQAGLESRKTIQRALKETAQFMRAKPIAPWTDAFYQLANRLAHLYFLRKHNRKAWLVLVNFVGDSDMGGPASAAEWQAAYKVAWHVLGIPDQNPLQRYVMHIYPDVADMSGQLALKQAGGASNLSC
jgi:hypothetical protein